MDDDLKFRTNKRAGQDYLAETFNLEYKRDDYISISQIERTSLLKNYRKEIGILEKDEVIGFNTGCSLLLSKQNK